MAGGYQRRTWMAESGRMQATTVNGISGVRDARTGGPGYRSEQRDRARYCALFGGQPDPDEPARSRRIDAVDVHSTVATASMTLWHGADTFTDVFLLVHADGRWRIANEAYHRRHASS
jgi:hypothetical protein